MSITKPGTCQSGIQIVLPKIIVLKEEQYLFVACSSEVHLIL